MVFKSGEAVPLARASIFLLDESAATLMRNAGLRSKDGKTDDQSILFSFILQSIGGSAEVVNSVTLIKQHVKYEIQTDFSGRALVNNIAPGKYYLFSYSQIRKAYVIWNMAIEIKEGDQIRIVLDQNNAAFAV